MALALGKTVAELLTTLTNDELVEWMAYYRIDPWGGYRSDLQTADIVRSTIGYKDSIGDLLLFDPDPITDEEREQREHAALIAQCERQTAKMSAMFDDMS